MGQHDPLDGLIMALELQHTASRLADAPAEPRLDREAARFAVLIDIRGLTTFEPLGLGGVLMDACRLAQLSPERHPMSRDLLEALLDAAAEGMRGESSARKSPFSEPREAKFDRVHNRVHSRLGLVRRGVRFNLRGWAAWWLLRLDHRLRTDPASILIAASIVYFVLWACAPPSTLPTVVPLRNHGHSLTAGVTVGGAPPKSVNEATNSVDVSYTQWPVLVADAQLAYYAQIFKVLDVGAMAGGGLSTVGWGGLMLRPRFETQNFAMGLQLEGGYLWASALAPLAVRIGPRLWLHGATGARVSALGPVIPIGLGVQYGAWEHSDLSFQFGSQVPLLSPGYTTVQGTLVIRWEFGSEIPRRSPPR